MYQSKKQKVDTGNELESDALLRKQLKNLKKFRVEKEKGVKNMKTSMILGQEESNIEKWCMFVHFSQHNWEDSSLDDTPINNILSKKWNPYYASIMDVTVYLSLLKEIYYLTYEELSSDLKALSCHLPNLRLENHALKNLCGLKFDIPPILKNYIIWTKKFTLRIPGYDICKLFVKYCTEKPDSQRDPFLIDDPEVVKDFISLLLERKNEHHPDEGILTVSSKFHVDNIINICTALEKYLKIAYNNGIILADSEPIVELLENAKFIDERVPLKNLDNNREPKGYDYTQFCAKLEDGFWELKLVDQILTDVGRKSLEMKKAAWYLGVTEDMLSCALKMKMKDPNCNLTLEQYVQKGFGNEAKFWKEMSTVELLDEVRNRNLLPKDAAFTLGVSRAKIMLKVGTVKTEEEVKEERVLAAVEKWKANSDRRKKRPTQLDMQINMMEKNIDGLSEYEIMRLQNLRERKTILGELGIAEDTKELKKISVKANEYKKPVDYGSRERSGRIKRKMEGLASQTSNVVKTQVKQLSPSWVGRWCPSKSKRLGVKDYLNDDEFNAASPVPQVVLNAKDIITPYNDFFKSRRFLNSVSEEFEETVDEKSLEKSLPRLYSKISDSKVSTSEIKSVDTLGDLVCFGDSTGGVGVLLDERSTTLKVHNEPVTRTLFLKDRHGNGILSGSQDGTVRLVDLAKQEVSVKYSWVETGEKEQIRWIEPWEDSSFLLNIDGKCVKGLDLRSGKANDFVELPPLDHSFPEVGEDFSFGTKELYLDSSFGTNISIHPLNSHLISICQQSEVKIYDMRSTKVHVDVINFDKIQPSESDRLFTRGIAGASWSPGSGSKFLACPVRSVMKKRLAFGLPLVSCSEKKQHFPHIYEGCYRDPVQIWPGKGDMFEDASFSANSGRTWCPWTEGVFFTTAVFRSTRNTRANIPSRYTVVAIDAASGEVLSEIWEGLDNLNYLIECHKERNWLVVGNARGAGDIVIYQNEK